jgi:hypothetical protein
MMFIVTWPVVDSNLGATALSPGQVARDSPIPHFEPLVSTRELRFEDEAVKCLSTPPYFTAGKTAAVLAASGRSAMRNQPASSANATGRNCTLISAMIFLI